MEYNDQEKKEQAGMDLTFTYQGKEYKCHVKGYTYFWWDEGNGSCDCNRSLELIRQGYLDEELPCGDEIEMQ